MPVGVIGVYETCAVDVELEEGLEPSVDFAEVFAISLDFYHLERLLKSHLRFASLLFHRQNAMLVAGCWHVAFEARDLLPRQFEIGKGLILENFDEFGPVCDEYVFTKTYLKDVGYIVVLLSVVTAAPIEIGSQGCR